MASNVASTFISGSRKLFYRSKRVYDRNLTRLELIFLPKEALYAGEAELGRLSKWEGLYFHCEKNGEAIFRKTFDDKRDYPMSLPAVSERIDQLIENRNYFLNFCADYFFSTNIKLSIPPKVNFHPLSPIFSEATCNVPKRQRITGRGFFTDPDTDRFVNTYIVTKEVIQIQQIVDTYNELLKQFGHAQNALRCTTGPRLVANNPSLDNK